MTTISGSSYYLQKGENIVFFDTEGNQLNTFPFKENDDLPTDAVTTDIFNKFDEMLDPDYRGKTRPVKIVIDWHPKLGRAILWFDKNENVIFYHRYDGAATYEAIIKNEREKHDGRFDLDWVVEKKIPISDIYRPPFSCKLL